MPYYFDLLRGHMKIYIRLLLLVVPSFLTALAHAGSLLCQFEDPKGAQITVTASWTGNKVERLAIEKVVTSPQAGQDDSYVFPESAPHMWRSQRPLISAVVAPYKEQISIDMSDPYFQGTGELKMMINPNLAYAATAKCTAH